jgi:hypothetical protein
MKTLHSITSRQAIFPLFVIVSLIVGASACSSTSIAGQKQTPASATTSKVTCGNGSLVYMTAGSTIASFQVTSPIGITSEQGTFQDTIEQTSAQSYLFSQILKRTYASGNEYFIAEDFSGGSDNFYHYYAEISDGTRTAYSCKADGLEPQGSGIEVTNCSCVVHPLDDSRDIYTSVSMLSATDGWVSGKQGIIRHWNGTTLETIASPVGNEDLNGISAVSPTDVWIVGGIGESLKSTLLHWNGTEWKAVKNPTDKTLKAITMISATDGWAIGSGGVILHWDGTEWKTVNSPTDKSLNAISMISATNGWAAGDFVTLRWDGSTWTASDNGSLLEGISMLNDKDVWAVELVSYKILHWDGSEWKNTTGMDEIDNAMHAISMVSATDGWAVGDAYDLKTSESKSLILRWNGTKWQEVPNPGSGWLSSISMINANDGWVVGWDGVLLHWDGVNWEVSFSKK